MITGKFSTGFSIFKKHLRAMIRECQFPMEWRKTDKVLRMLVMMPIKAAVKTFREIWSWF
jgi:hypothetical protein